MQVVNGFSLGRNPNRVQAPGWEQGGQTQRPDLNKQNNRACSLRPERLGKAAIAGRVGWLGLGMHCELL